MALTQVQGGMILPSTTLTTPIIATTMGVGGATPAASGSGITFPATQSASSDANTLDDYETGAWTPTLTGTSGGTYTMSGANIGRYVKIGRLVTLFCTLQWSAAPVAYSGNLLVGGIPFTASTVRGIGTLGAVSYGLSFTSGYGQWVTVVDPGLSGFYIIQGSTSGSGYSHGPNVGTTGLVYAVTVQYYTGS